MSLMYHFMFIFHLLRLTGLRRNLKETSFITIYAGVLRTETRLCWDMSILF